MKKIMLITLWIPCLAAANVTSVNGQSGAVDIFGTSIKALKNVSTASNAIAVGDASAVASSTAYGASASASASGSTAIGRSASVPVGADNGVAVGRYASVTGANQVAVGNRAIITSSTDGAMQIGGGTLSDNDVSLQFGAFPFLDLTGAILPARLPTGLVKSVNGAVPDANGNVIMPTGGGVTSVNGLTGDVVVYVPSSPVIEGTITITSAPDDSAGIKIGGLGVVDMRDSDLTGWRVGMAPGYSHVTESNGLEYWDWGDCQASYGVRSIKSYDELYSLKPGNPDQIVRKKDLTPYGQVKTVNGVSPDSSGNVSISTGGGNITETDPTVPSWAKEKLTSVVSFRDPNNFAISLTRGHAQEHYHSYLQDPYSLRQFGFSCDNILNPMIVFEAPTNTVMWTFPMENERIYATIPAASQNWVDANYVHREEVVEYVADVIDEMVSGAGGGLTLYNGIQGIKDGSGLFSVADGIADLSRGFRGGTIDTQLFALYPGVLTLKRSSNMLTVDTDFIAWNRPGMQLTLRSNSISYSDISSSPYTQHYSFHSGDDNQIARKKDLGYLTLSLENGELIVTDENGNEYSITMTPRN